MSRRPVPIRIDDLAEPKFSEDARAILDFMEDAGSDLTLEPESLMEVAMAETGLDDFGAEDFVERLNVLCRAMREEGGFNGAGMLQQHVFITALLKNRLLLEDLVRRHPEILEERIVAPIIICGLPRTGTTHLHNLMSADPALRSLPYWESLEPVLAESEQPVPGAPDPRQERTAMALSFLDSALPYFNRMHEMTVEHTHEEIQLLAIDFSTMLFETTAPMPTWRDYYLSHDQGPSYAYLLKILKVLQWLRGGTRWVLKSPQHLEQFPTLVDTFPDATFVVTHRDPVSVTASMVTMIAYTARLTRDRVDLESMGRYWADRLERMLHRCATERAVLPAEQTIDVHFDQFMGDDLAMVGRVYELAGQPLDDRAEASMASFTSEHPRGRHGAVLYDLREFGLDPGRAPCRAGVLHRPLRSDARILSAGSEAASADGRTADAPPAARHVDAEVQQQHDGRQHMPADVAERDTDAAWVEDHLVAREGIVSPRGEHVEGQQGEDHVRPCQPAAAAEPAAGASQVPEQPRHGVTALHHVHTGERQEGHPDDEMRPPLRDRRRGGQRGCEGRQETEVDCEAGSHAAPLRRYSAQWWRGVLAGHAADVTAKGHGSTTPSGGWRWPTARRRPSSHPTAAATSGMAITMRNRLLHGM